MGTVIPEMLKDTDMTTEYTPEQLQSMRDWVSECDWLDDVLGYDDATIIAGITKHYEGGVAAFLISL